MEKSFRDKVLEAVSMIPRGKVLSYAEVARIAGSPRAFRVVGTILRSNRDYKNIPCHRVIKSDGSTGEYNRGPKMKRKLLINEGVAL